MALIYRSTTHRPQCAEGPLVVAYGWSHCLSSSHSRTGQPAGQSFLGSNFSLISSIPNSRSQRLLQGPEENGPATTPLATSSHGFMPATVPTTCCLLLPFLLVLLNVFGPGGAEADHIRVRVSYFHIQRRLAPLKAGSSPATNFRGGTQPTPEPPSQPSVWRGWKASKRLRGPPSPLPSARYLPSPCPLLPDSTPPSPHLPSY